MGKIILILGIALVAVGVVFILGERLGLGRLPGDIVIVRENTRIYIPLMSSLIVSVVLSFILWLMLP